jgi:hypothetical protein
MWAGIVLLTNSATVEKPTVANISAFSVSFGPMCLLEKMLILFPNFKGCKYTSNSIFLKQYLTEIVLKK